MGSRLRNRGKTGLYHLQSHYQAVQGGQGPDTNSIPAEWSDFEQFALACKTRQKNGIKGLELYPWQHSLMRLIEREGSVVICKSRQVGGSQALLLRCLWRALHEPGFMGLIASKSFADAQLLARRMRRALQGLPGVEPVNDSLSHLVLPNDSQILFRSSSPADGLSRGVDALSFVLADEYSFWDDAATAMGSLGPAMAQTQNPELVLVSTPNGQTNDYWEKLTQGMGAPAFENLLKRVREGEIDPYQEHVSIQGMAVAVCHWRAIPAYASEPDFLGRMAKQFGLSKSDIKREFELNFEESATSVFTVADVRQCIIEKTLEDTEEWGIYGTGVDASAATGGDYTVAITLKLEPSTNIVSVVAMWRKRTGAIATHINAVIQQCECYPGRILIETNGVGAQWPEQVGAALPHLEVQGFHSSQSKKLTNYGRLQLALEQKLVQFQQGPLVNELLSLQYKDGNRIEAAGAGHDDCADALALALTAIKWNPKRQY